MPRPTAKQRLQTALLGNAGVAGVSLRAAVKHLAVLLAETPALEARGRVCKQEHERMEAESLLAAMEEGRYKGNAEERKAQLTVYCWEQSKYAQLMEMWETSKLALAQHQAAVETAANAFNAARYDAKLNAATMEMVAATSEK